MAWAFAIDHEHGVNICKWKWTWREHSKIVANIGVNYFDLLPFFQCKLIFAFLRKKNHSKVEIDRFKFWLKRCSRIVHFHWQMFTPFHGQLQMFTPCSRQIAYVLAVFTPMFPRSRLVHALFTPFFSVHACSRMFTGVNREY